MKKLLLFLALMCGVSLSWAYNFSAVAPSGQTLYYNIVNVYAQVTAPEFDVVSCLKKVAPEKDQKRTSRRGAINYIYC